MSVKNGPELSINARSIKHKDWGDAFLYQCALSLDANSYASAYVDEYVASKSQSLAITKQRGTLFWNIVLLIIF